MSRSTGGQLNTSSLICRHSPMPPMGGVQLSPADLAAVSAYVWSLGHSPKP